MAFFSTVPISEPVRKDFVANDNLGGFGWDQRRGLFVIVEEELDMTIKPYHGAVESMRKPQ